MNDRATAPETCDGVVCYAAIDWWYHNRGHSECQIMRRLAARVPVLWVNSLGLRAPSPGKSDLIVRRYARKLRSTMRGLRRDPCGMWVYSPIFIPKYNDRFASINGALVSRQVGLISRCLGIRKPSVFATIPTAAPAIEKGPWVRTVFNRSDEFSAFPEADARFVRGLEQRMLRAADSTLYVNRLLYERERQTVADPIFLGHGVDFDHFDRPRTPLDAVPEQIRSLPRPIVGFYGALDGYTIDLELMVKCARSVAPGTLLVIGPKAMDISALLDEPNVAYLGPIPYEELPDYATQFDVGIMPWLDNEWIRGCNPIKLKEYLALGFPVVTTDFDQLDSLRPLVRTSRTHDEFLNQVDDALNDRDPAVANRSKDAVRHDSWDRIAETVGCLLGVGSIDESNRICAV